MKTAIRVNRGSTLLAEQRFYDNTFLRGDESVLLFICDAALVRGPSGRERLRVNRDLIEFPDEASMIAAVTDGGWVEAPLEEDRQWRPTVDQLVSP